MNFYSLLNEGFDKILNEAKQDEINFTNVFGAELKDRFLKQKPRLKSPENDFYHWIRKSKQDLEGTINELDSRLSELENKLTRSQRAQLAAEGAEPLYEDDDWVVLRIDEYPAAAKYGAGTVWCITGRYNNEEDNGEYWFDHYKEEYGWDYYFFIRKDGRDLEGHQEKYCLCWNTDSNDEYTIWDAQDHTLSCIPDAPQVEGLPDITVPQEGHEDEDDYEAPDPNAPWTDENGVEHAGPRPPEVPNPMHYTVNDPDAFEYHGADISSLENALAAFKRAFAADSGETIHSVENVEQLAPDLYAIKVMVDPETEEFDLSDGSTYERTIPGDRYVAFIYRPREGAGPLLNRAGNNQFHLVGFLDMDSLRREFGGEHFNPQNVNRNDQEPNEGMPEGLQEKFYYYDDGSWFYNL